MLLISALHVFGTVDLSKNESNTVYTARASHESLATENLFCCPPHLDKRGAAGVSKAENDLRTRRASRRRHYEQTCRATVTEVATKKEESGPNQLERAEKDSAQYVYGTGNIRWDARSSKRGRSCQMLTQRPAGGPSNARSFGRRGVRYRKARTPDFLQASWGRACFATKVRRGRRKTAITGGRCEGPKSSKEKQQKKVPTATLRLFIADRDRFRSLDLR